MRLVAAYQDWREIRALKYRLKELDTTGTLRLAKVLNRGEHTDVCRLRGPDGALVVKLARSAEGRTRIAGEAELLRKKAKRLGSGSDRVPEVLRHDAGTGSLLLEHIPAPSLAVCLDHDGFDRAALVRRAAQWCAAYTRGERVSDDFGGGTWLRFRESQAARLSGGRAADAASGLLDLMVRERHRVANRPVTRARSHGNLTPQNILVDGETVWGVGVEAGPWIATIKDVARFLVHLSADHPGGAAPGVCGLDAGAIAAFTRAGLFYPGEIDALLPFFAASELVGLLATGVTPARLELAGRMIARGGTTDRTVRVQSGAS